MSRYLFYLIFISLFAVFVQMTIAESLSIKGRVIITVFLTTPFFIILWSILALKDLGKRTLLLGGSALLAWLAPAIWLAARILSGLGGHSHIQHENIIVMSITFFNIALMLSLLIIHEKYKPHT